MDTQDPTSWKAATWGLGLGMALAGGFVNWCGRVRVGTTRVFNLVELVGELFTSGFVGLMMFMLLIGYDVPIGVAAAASGVSGHMATRLLFLIERVIEARLMKHEREHHAS